ncbi:MAG: cytidylate kinase family protein [Spirochaetia bacterium]|nr:cytidylate kinase family protein [Spirochaetia bacterium]
MRNKPELIKRYSVFFLGIITNAVGVAFITRSMLGTGPTTCIPYVASLKFPYSFGTFTFMFNTFLLILQILILRKNFKLHQLLQIPASFLFSVCIDAAMHLTAALNVNFYIMALLYTVIGCVFRAFGACCQVIADVVMLSPEALVKAVSDITKKEFGICKLVCDATMVAIAVCMSFYFLGNLQAVREGTLLTILLVGPISQFFISHLVFTNHYFENEGEFVYESKLKIENGKRLVITITTEAGSGGRKIAEILGNLLGIHIYNKEFTELIAKEGNLPLEFVRKHNERLYTNGAEAFFRESYFFAENGFDHYRRIYAAQSKVIRRLAETQDCIIIGHCSNYILKNMEGALHIFIGTNIENRVRYLSSKYGISPRKAYEKIRKQDEDTNKYYKILTGQNWKDSDNYHISIDSAIFGNQRTAEMIEYFIKKRYNQLSSIGLKDLISYYQENNEE